MDELEPLVPFKGLILSAVILRIGEAMLMGIDSKGALHFDGVGRFSSSLRQKLAVGHTQPLRHDSFGLGSVDNPARPQSDEYRREVVYWQSLGVKMTCRWEDEA